jgi:hypothetical protein
MGVEGRGNMNKEFTMKVTCNGEGLNISTEACGFSGLELLGLLAWKQQDLIDQMRGTIKPDIVTRTRIAEPEATHGTT